MKIRAAVEEDLHAICKIESACYENPWPIALFRGHLGEDGFLIYSERGRLLGYIVVGIKIPTLFERLEKRSKALAGHRVNLDESTGHLMNVAVDPSHRGRGIAKALLHAGFEYLNSLGATFVELEVRQSNRVAIELYTQFGFESIRVIRNYYPDEDALMMRKVL